MATYFLRMTEATWKIKYFPDIFALCEFFQKIRLMVVNSSVIKVYIPGFFLTAHYWNRKEEEQ